MTIELAVLAMCIISLIWDAINTYLIIKKNKTYEIEVEEIEDKLQPSAFEPIEDKEIKNIHTKETTKTGRRTNFKFSMVDIIPGTTIISKINPKEKAIVVDEKRIQFRGEITTTTAAAITIMKECRPNRKVVDLTGPDYWLYNNTTLTQLRILKEQKNDNSEKVSNGSSAY